MTLEGFRSRCRTWRLCEGDGVADAHKPIEELAEFERAHSVVEPAGSVERLDHAVKGFAADESHRVERPSSSPWLRL